MNIHRTASTRAKTPASESGATASRRKRRAAIATGLAAAALLPMLVSSGTGSAAAPPPAHPGPAGPNTVGLKQVGPIDETNGFPLWYKDTSGQRLELCLDASDPYCVMGAVPTPGQPLVFPTNFPDEAFWSMADASLDDRQHRRQGHSRHRAGGCLRRRRGTGPADLLRPHPAPRLRR